MQKQMDKPLRHDVIEGNYYCASLASYHKFDVLDLHYYFRFDDQHRLKDGIHWDRIVHRRITQLLLSHIADAWGIEVPEKKPVDAWRKEVSKKKPVSGPHNARRKNSMPLYNQSAVQYALAALRPYPSSYRGPVHDENSNYCARRQYNGVPSSKMGYRPPFVPSGPPISYQCGEMNSSYYDDSPVLTNNYCLGYTSFEHESSQGNDMSRGLHSNEDDSMMPNTSPYANFSNLLVQKFGSYPTHMEYPPALQLNQSRSNSSSLVIRRPLQQRDGGALRPRQYVLPYGRY